MRHLLLLAGLAGLCTVSAASAGITAFWVPVASGDGSVGSMYPAAATKADPVLLGMQTWDLRATTDGNWSEAGLRAVLPSGTFYRRTSTGITKPEIITLDRAFWTYVTVPSYHHFSDDHNPLNVLGGFPVGQPVSNGTSNGLNIPGTFSCHWGDLTNDPPSPPERYQIARLTFPLGVVPDILTVDQNPSFSYTSQVVPNATTAIPEILEPTTLALVCCVSLLGFRARRVYSLTP